MYKRRKKTVYIIIMVLCVILSVYLIVKSFTSVSSGSSVPPAISEESIAVSAETIKAPVVTTTKAVETTSALTEAPETEESVVTEHTPVYDYTEEELDLLARLIYSEGGIESYDTQLMIGSVVMNRVDDPHFPNTIEEVIYQKNQFSVTTIKSNGVAMIDYPADEDAKNAAYEVLNYGSVLPQIVQVFYEKSIKTGWVATREVYGTFDHTTFAFIFPKGEK